MFVCNRVVAELATAFAQDAAAQLGVPTADVAVVNMADYVLLDVSVAVAVGARCVSSVFAVVSASTGLSRRAVCTCDVQATLCVTASALQEAIASESGVLVFVLSTWTDGAPPVSAAPFCDYISDMAVDFRVSKATLAKVRFAAFGLGDSGFGPNFCTYVSRAAAVFCRSASHARSSRCFFFPLPQCGLRWRYPHSCVTCDRAARFIPWSAICAPWAQFASGVWARATTRPTSTRVRVKCTRVWCLQR
jgi:hypothetical protein